ncbi:MAG: prephenate dehydrogenase, partial [Bacteroidales bacterium]|nr:prephenate dehydrogenase [Bacteroidales bacterium]
NMGSWLVESLCLDYEVGVYDVDRGKLKYFFNSRKFLYYEEILDFTPDLLINAVSLDKTIALFDEFIPYLPERCIIADITSVKSGLAEYYKKLGRRFVSTHPMFGPTFGNVKDLSNENAIIISESDEEGKAFFREFYSGLKIKVHEYTFKEHDETIAYSLSIPFSSTMVFAACMKEQEAPGTTFKKHFSIAKGLLSEDDYLLSEILLSPHSLGQVERISDQLEALIGMIKARDKEKLNGFFHMLRSNIGLES